MVCLTNSFICKPEISLNGPDWINVVNRLSWKSCIGGENLLVLVFQLDDVTTSPTAKILFGRKIFITYANLEQNE